MIDTLIVPKKTVASAKGEGPAVDINAAKNRVFLLTLCITKIIEQEALDVSIHGSNDGATWTAAPLASFPQKFYAEESPLLLDLTGQKDIRFLRAQWNAIRWGRGSETPMFEFHVGIREVPTEILKQATAEAKSLL